MDEFIGFTFFANTITTSEMLVNKAKNIVTTVVFQSQDSVLNPMFNSDKKTWSNVCGKNVVDNNKAILMGAPTSKHNKID
jgi:hypothetical protein